LESAPLKQRVSADAPQAIERFIFGYITTIEQIPDKPSRWGQLAKESHSVVQIKDVERNKFVAVSIDGKVKE
jgi:hypothetical protein